MSMHVASHAGEAFEHFLIAVGGLGVLLGGFVAGLSLIGRTSDVVGLLSDPLPSLVPRIPLQSGLIT
jgi:hypothetical protein